MSDMVKLSQDILTESKVWQDGDVRFRAYLDVIAAVLGHAGRVAPMRAYCVGLLLPGERKSVELMATRVRPGCVQPLHQAMHHVVAKAAWDDAAVLGAVRRQVLPAIERHGPVRYWVLDTIRFPKQGSHSVGVARQPCDRAGKQDNCQVAVSLSVANEHASLPIAYRLSLPQAWADDPLRRAKAGVPEEIKFETEAMIALGHVRQAHADDVPRGIVLGDAEYGCQAELRSGVNGLGLSYVLSVPSSMGVRPPAAASPDGAGDGPASARSLALGLPAEAWHGATWREENQAEFWADFAAVRVRPEHGDAGAASKREEWLLVERAGGGPEPTGYWLSNLPLDTPLQALAQAAKGRWRTRRDLQELRQGAGLQHYEGRGWRGFHHHASLSIAAYGFLTAERCLFRPALRFNPRQITLPLRPDGFRPRGSASMAQATRAIPLDAGPRVANEP